jgi:DNA-binding CsgD family transcriptional regulator
VPNSRGDESERRFNPRMLTEAEKALRAAAGEENARETLRQMGLSRHETRTALLWAQGYTLRQIRLRLDVGERLALQHLERAKEKVFAAKQARDSEDAKHILRVFPNKHTGQQDENYISFGSWYSEKPPRPRFVDLERLLGSREEAVLATVEAALR